MGIRLDGTQVVAVAAFLRVINVLENIRQGIDLLEASVKQPTAGQATESLDLAVHRTEDSVRVLEGGGLHPEAVARLKEARRLQGMLLWGGTAYAHGQEATEIFIPVGQSPGLSGKITIIGTIEAVNTATRTITIAGASGPWTAEITDRTSIWQDRSKLRLSNQNGAFTDLGKGRVVEVKYEDSQGNGKRPARWVKVQVTQ